MVPLSVLCVKPQRSLRLIEIFKKRPNIVLLLCFLFLLLTINNSFSQEKSMSEVISSAAEELAAEESDPSLAGLYAELLADLSDDPVRINSGEENEISRLFFLSSFQVKVLADHISKNGPVYSIYEIASIPGYDREAASLMAPFISLKNTSNDEPVLRKPHQTLLTNFIVKPGVHEPDWPGSAVRSLIKYRIDAGSLSGGFTAEKDPGEKFLSGNPPAPDFLSAYLSYSGKGIIKRVVAGDFSARFGQGTGLNTGVNTVFSITSPGNISGRDEIKPYTSADENAFLRGLSITAGVKKGEISIFHSVSNIDASLDTSLLTGEISVRTLYKTGYHNSASSILKKDAVKETVSGAALSYNNRNFRSGLLWTMNSFSIPVIPEKNGAESLYKFEGKQNSVISFYYNYLLSRFLLSGEISSNAGKGYAINQNISFRPSDRLNINLLYRNYSPRYINFHGRGPGGSYTSNENSITGSFSFEAAKGLFVSAGSEVRSFPWLRYGVSSPSSSVKREIRVKFIPSAKFILESCYQYRSSMEGASVTRGIAGLDEEKSRSLRIQARYAVAEKVTLLTRADYRIVRPSGHEGFLILQDLIINLKKVSLWYRYCVFNTGGYDSGIYTYENDLLSSFSIPVLYGRGSRTYIMAAWKISSFADIRFKYWISGSSKAGIIDNSDEIRAQFRIRF
jgi:hypothetical protein